jgi:hypothetical protein
MFRRPLRRSAGAALAVVLAGILAMPAALVRAEDAPDLDKVPGKVMDALMAKFPKAEIHKWTKEKEGDIVVYDFEFMQGGEKLEADVAEDGTIHNWEKEISAKELPTAVKAAVEKAYPKATLREVMAITAVKEGKDALEGYEVVLQTGDERPVEVTFAPDGRILEAATTGDEAAAEEDSTNGEGSGEKE